MQEVTYSVQLNLTIVGVLSTILALAGGVSQSTSTVSNSVKIIGENCGRYSIDTYNCLLGETTGKVRFTTMFNLQHLPCL